MDADDANVGCVDDSLEQHDDDLARERRGDGVGGRDDADGVVGGSPGRLPPPPRRIDGGGPDDRVGDLPSTTTRGGGDVTGKKYGLCRMASPNATIDWGDDLLPSRNCLSSLLPFALVVLPPPTSRTTPLPDEGLVGGCGRGDTVHIDDGGSPIRAVAPKNAALALPLLLPLASSPSLDDRDGLGNGIEMIPSKELARCSNGPPPTRSGVVDASSL